ncbi:MAG: peptidase M14 [Acidobacteriota bacterium]|nr:MAG: peptidase M14 [Acidobacteriota bacterium]
MFQTLRGKAGAAVLMAALCFAAFTPVFAQVAAPNSELIVARIAVKTDADMRRVMDLGLDLMEYREGDDLIFITTAAQIAELQRSGFDVRPDKKLTAELPRNGVETFNGGYRTVEETYAFLNQMQASYPNLARVFTYGDSWLKVQNPVNGYKLTGITLTSQSSDRRPKPTFLLQAGLHARELVPPELATRFISYLLTNYGIDADATWLLDEHRIVVIPIMNPDGRKIAETGALKRKNMNNLSGSCTTVTTGIDLNRNYSFRWGIVNPPTEPCGETFPGLTAASEPEIAYQEALIATLFPDQRGAPRNEPAPIDATGAVLDMHSTGNLILYPWGEDTLPPPNPQIVTLARKMAAYNGYNPIQGVNLYPTSGSAKDYAYGELGAVSMTMEIGNGSGTCGGFMPAYTCIEGGGTAGNFWSKNLPVLLYMAKTARTPYMIAEGPTAETLTITALSTASFRFRAQFSDEFNGGQPIAAAEAYLNTPPWRGGTPIAMTPEDGSFNSMNEYALATFNIRSGTHIIYVRARDTAGNWGSVKAVFKTDGLWPAG